MMKRLVVAVMVLGFLVPLRADSQDARATLDGVAKALGATGLKSIQYAGTGTTFAVGQSPNPDAPWPRFNLKSYMRTIDYDSGVSREEIVRTQAEDPPRGGGQQPVIGEQRQIFLLNGPHAWNQVGDNTVAAPLTAGERRHQLWITPHGVIKAAMANNAAVRSRADGPRKLMAISFAEPGRFKVEATVNDQNLVERVESWAPNAMVGDLLTETTYADYQDFGGVKFPTRIRQAQGGFPTLDLTVNAVQPNVAVSFPAPENVQNPLIRVTTEAVADGVWYLAGGTHHSVVIEMKDHLIVMEGPQYDDRAVAVIAEAKKLAPNKPIRYVVNTHHHFDHAGGLGAFVAEGATVVTHEINKPFFERAFAAPRTLKPDRLAASGKRATFQTLTDRLVMTDGARAVEIHHIKGNLHHDGLIMAYLPKERLLIEADAYTPAAANAPPPAKPNPFHVNLNDNIERLNLSVDRILPLHGRIVALAELHRAIGKQP